MLEYYIIDIIMVAIHQTQLKACLYYDMISAHLLV